jgi:hypothetical protein
MSKNQNATKKTLDIQYLNKLQEFEAHDSTISKLHKDIENVKIKLKKYQSSSNELNDAEFNIYIELTDKLAQLKNQLQKYESQDDEIDYYMNTAPILFQYYDILENGKDVNTIRKPVTTEKSILKYFAQNNQPDPVPEDISSPNIDRASLLDRYLHMTDSNYVKAPESEKRDKCPFCECTDRNIMLNEGMIYCNSCNGIEYIIVDHERPTYRDPPREIYASQRSSIYNLLEKYGFEKQYAWINWRYIRGNTFRTLHNIVQLLVC